MERNTSSFGPAVATGYWVHQVTWRANSSYAGRQGNRAGERFMRLRLFDRIRRLAHFRRSPAETAPGASGAQGRHRRHRRGGPATAPGSLDFPGGPDSSGGPHPARDRAPAPGDWSRPPGPSGGAPPIELAHTASPWPDGSPVAEAPVTPGTPAPRRDPAQAWADPRVGGSHRAAGASAARAGAGRARIREAPAPPEAAVGLAQAPAASLAETREAETGPGGRTGPGG